MIRTSSVRDVGIKEETGLPVIGLIKREYPGYTGRITMTMREVDECMEALSDIISIDCTDCTRGDGLTAPEFLKQVKRSIRISSSWRTARRWRRRKPPMPRRGSGWQHDERLYAADGGLQGDPNYELVEQMVAELPCPVIAEGRVHTPEQAKRCWNSAWAVVVGGAITVRWKLRRAS
ncbi:MAG: hypothetical protein ACLUI3_06590 [Christensenellales bacterium]